LVSPYLGRFCQILIQGNFLSFSPSFMSFYLLPSNWYSSPIAQREISNAADIAARIYHETNPEDRRSALEIWETMTKAQDKLIKSIRTRNFEKYISIAHKDNGEDFFGEVFPLPFLVFLWSHLGLHFLFFVSMYLYSTLLFNRLTVIFHHFLCRI
jgi:hypothetical protein